MLISHICQPSKWLHLVISHWNGYILKKLSRNSGTLTNQYANAPLNKASLKIFEHAVKSILSYFKNNGDDNIFET